MARHSTSRRTYERVHGGLPCPREERGRGAAGTFSVHRSRLNSFVLPESDRRTLSSRSARARVRSRASLPRRHDT